MTDIFNVVSPGACTTSRCQASGDTETGLERLPSRPLLSASIIWLSDAVR